MEPIEELSEYSFPDTKSESDGYYDWKTVPDLSAKNIEVLMNKINEVISIVNQLIPGAR